MKKIYRKANRYIQDYHILKWVIYLLKNNKCYKAEQLLKKVYDNVTQLSTQSVWRKQYISEYKEIKYIYERCWKEIPQEYFIKIDYEADD